MKLTITIPDDQIPDLRRMALESSKVEGRTISPTTLCAQMVTAAILADLDEAQAMADAMTDDLPTVAPRPRTLSQREADARLLPPVEELLLKVDRPAADELELLERALADAKRKRAAAGLDPETGASPDAKATRAAVEGKGPRPMGFVRPMVEGRTLNPGRAPETPATKVEPGTH